MTLWACCVIGIGSVFSSGAAVPVSQQAYVKASNTQAQDLFGAGAAIFGNTMVVGAPYEASNATGVDGDQTDNSIFEAGAAYVFVRNGANWTQQAYLKASNPGQAYVFGDAIAISGDTIVVGSTGEASLSTGVNGSQAPSGAKNAGAVYVFVRNGTVWNQQAYLKPSNTDAGDQFGYSVSISGNTIVVGASGESSSATGINGDQSNNDASRAGAAYVFVRDGTTWTQQAYLKASNAEAGDRFGYSVSISGNTVIVGAEGESSSATGVNGNQNSNGASKSGAAYVFTRTGTNWTQEAYLKASNTGENDLFGHSVALAGVTAVVTAYEESSSAKGVNGPQNDNNAPSSGAAYVFVRTGTNWSQQAYLKPSNTSISNWFGYSAAISRDTIVIGAMLESSASTGVDGPQENTSAWAAGASYVFVRRGTSWSQQAYLKASNTDVGDLFGGRVALWGDTAVIGAYQEASSATGINSGGEGDNSATRAGAAYVFTGLGLGLGPQLDVVPSCYTVTFNALPNAMYRLERAATPQGPWNTLTMVTAPDSGIVEYVDVNPPFGHSFYRAVEP